MAQEKLFIQIADDAFNLVWQGEKEPILSFPDFKQACVKAVEMKRHHRKMSGNDIRVIVTEQDLDAISTMA